MNKYQGVFLIIFILNFISCKDYSDLELVSKTKVIDISNPTLEVALLVKKKSVGIENKD